MTLGCNVRGSQNKGPVGNASVALKERPPMFRRVNLQGSMQVFCFSLHGRGSKQWYQNGTLENGTKD